MGDFSTTFRRVITNKRNELKALYLRAEAVTQDTSALGIDAKPDQCHRILLEATRVKEKLASSFEVIKNNASKWRTALDEIEDEGEKDQAESDLAKFFTDTETESRSIPAIESDITDKTHDVMAEITTLTRMMSVQRPTSVLMGTSAVPSETHSSDQMAESRYLAPLFTGQVPIPQLPSLTLPTFNGKDNYKDFWTVFSDLIDKKDLGDATKLRYFESSLEGEAQDLLKHLKKRGTTYPAIVRHFETEYGKNDEARQRLLDQWSSLRPKSESLEDQQRAVNEIETLQYELKQLEVEMDGNHYVAHEVVKRFSHASQRALLKAQREQKKQFSLNEALSELKKHLAEELHLRNRLPKKTTKEPREKTDSTPVSAVSDSSKKAGKETTDKSLGIAPIAGKVVGTKQSCIFCGKHTNPANCFIKQIEKRSILKAQGRCMKCFEHGHTADKCKQPDCALCGEKHNFSVCDSFRLHNPRFNKHSDQHNATLPISVGTELTREDSVDKGIERPMATATTTDRVRMLTGSAKLKNPVSGQEKEADVFLDCGAAITLISDRMRESLQLPTIRRETFDLTGVGGRSEGPKEYEIVSVSLPTQKGVIRVEAVVHPEPLTGALPQARLTRADKRALQQLRTTLAQPLHRTSRVTPQLLIGGNEFYEITGMASSRLPSGLLTVPTALGTMIAGDQQFPSSQKKMMPVTTLTVTSNESESASSEQSIKNFLALDSAGQEDLMSTEKKSRMELEEEINKFFSENIQFIDGSYHARYAFNDRLESLTDGFNQAWNRLKNLYKKIGDNKDILLKIEEIFTKQLQANQMEKVEAGEGSDNVIRYIPLQVVIKESSETTPCRLVIDASSRTKNEPSLNDCLLGPGTNLLDHIPKMIIRTRLHHTLMAGDIEKAFLQIKIFEDQRDLLRVLWLKDPFQPPSLENLQILRYSSAAFGIKQSPYILMATLRHHAKYREAIIDQQFRQIDELLDEENREPSEAEMEQLRQLSLERKILDGLVTNCYVDNLFFECDESTDLMEVFQKAKSVFRDMGMNIRSFFSSDDTFTAQLSKENGDQGPIGRTKILGLTYDTTIDSWLIHCGLDEQAGEVKMTKRKVLSKLASIYDPMGYLVPLLLPMKVFLQKTFVKYGWDQIMDEADQIEWSRLCRLVRMEEIAIPRLITLPMRPIHLVLFTDGSFAAMGAVIYLWTETGPKFLMARNQLAPAKAPKTTPKLELQALVMGMNLLLYSAQAIAKEHRRRFRFQVYTDATTLLHWIRAYRADHTTGKALGVYVKNRLKKIHETEELLKDLAHMGYHSVPYNDRREAIRYDHVTGAENPADHATRGLAAADMENPDHIWWKGPEWLKRQPEEWKREHSNANWADCEQILENAVGTVPLLSITEGHHPPSITVEPRRLDPIRVEDYSSYTRLQKVVALMLRFIKIKCPSTVNKFTCFKHSPATSTCPSAGEMEEARIILLRQHQSLNSKDAEKLKGKDIGIELGQDGLLRITSGRIDNALIDEETKRPILLFRQENALPRLMINDMHERLFHRGATHVLAEMRKKYCLIRGKQVVKTELRECTLCKMMHKAACPYPAAPPLPAERVCDSRPFQHIGLDFLGPIKVKTAESNEDESAKAYVLLCTCMSTRLIHLEVTKSLSTLAFLNALERFVSRRGAPTSITSDRAPTFKTSDKLLKERCKAYQTEDRILAFAAEQQIEWKWITAHSPWMGGFYERLVGCVKSAFNSAFRKKTLPLDDLHTQMCRVEAVLNSRPLTHLSADLQSSLELPILRPCDFISPKVKLALPHSTVTRDSIDDPDFDPSPKSDVTRKELIARLNQAEANLEKFWEVFRTFYLSELREHGRLHPLRQGSHCQQPLPFPDEIVLVVEDNVPRGSWKLARVISCDGREVVLQSSAGREITRPLNKVIPLEIISSDATAPTNTEDPHPPSEPRLRRSERSAAKKAREQIRRWTDSESEEEDKVTTDRKRARRGGRMIEKVPMLGLIREDTPTRPPLRGMWSFNGTFAVVGMIMLCLVIPVATEQRFSCERNGATFHHDGDMEEYQICSEEECKLIRVQENSSHETTYFSTSSTLHGFSVLIKYMVNGTAVLHSHDCPAYDFCEHITCTICMVALLNPECNIMAALITMALLFYIIALSVYQICFTPVILSRPFQFLFHFLLRLMKWLGSTLIAIVSWPFSSSGRRRKPNSRQKYSALLMLITLMMQFTRPVEGCADVLRFSSESETCNGQQCHEYMNSLLKINTVSREACIALMKDDVLVGEVKLTLVTAEMYCEKNTLGFHRNVETKFVSVKRCPRVGSCRGDKCEEVNEDSMIPELKVGNPYPGHTHCVESCGGPGCDCFFLSSGCLYYRTFVTPRSEEVYETFECTEWHPVVTVNMTITIGNETTVDTVRLLPNQRKTVLYHKLELTNFAVPPLPLLDKKFISSINGRKLGLLTHLPITKCASADRATEFNCTAQEDCQCTPAERTAMCNCQQIDLEENYQIEGILPILTPSMQLNVYNRKPYATISQALSMEVAMSLDQKRWKMDKMKVTPFECKVVSTPLTGCYSCLKGARVNLTCTSTVPTGLAAISCERDFFSIPCDSRAATSSRAITADSAVILQKCNVSCGKPVEIYGMLKYASDFTEKREYTEGIRGEINGTYEFDFSGFPDLSHIGSIFLSYWLQTVVVVILVGLAVLLTLYCCIPALPFILSIVIGWLRGRSTATRRKDL